MNRLKDAPETAELFQVRYPKHGGVITRTFTSLAEAEQMLDILENEGVPAEFAILCGEFKPYPNGDEDEVQS